METNYMDIMIQSLKKKILILDQLLQLNKQQGFLLQDPNLSPEEFERNMGNKSNMIDELNQLDEGFENLFDRIKEEIHNNKKKHALEIAQMQDLIREIMDKSNMVKTQEARNKDQVVQKFSDVRKQVKEVRKSQKVVKQYYESMTKQDFSTSQFVDNKK